MLNWCEKESANVNKLKMQRVTELEQKERGFFLQKKWVKWRSQETEWKKEIRSQKERKCFRYSNSIQTKQPTVAVNQWIRSLSVTLINTYRHLCPTLEKNLNMVVSDDQFKKKRKKRLLFMHHTSPQTMSLELLSQPKSITLMLLSTI